jgi:hypothetical protein
VSKFKYTGFADLPRPKRVSEADAVTPDDEAVPAPPTVVPTTKSTDSNNKVDSGNIPDSIDIPQSVTLPQSTNLVESTKLPVSTKQVEVVPPTAQFTNLVDSTTYPDLTTLAPAEGWMVIPHAILDTLWTILPESETKVYVRLYRLAYGWDSDCCRVGFDKLARACGISRTTAQKAI